MNWIEPLKPNPKAKLRLICCHHSGVGASAYNPWIKQVPDFVELKAIQLPGRESRFGEPLLTSIESIIEGLMKDFLRFIDKPYLLFGHSMGALIAYELSRKLQAKKIPLPKTLIISGCRAPNLLPLQNIYALPENEFIEKLIGYNGIPKEVLSNKDLLELFLPILRADFYISETYRYHKSSPLQCDIAALGGVQDPTVTTERLKEWEIHTSSYFSIHLFPGDHFFVKSALNNVIAVINKIAIKALKKEDAS